MRRGKIHYTNHYDFNNKDFHSISFCGLKSGMEDKHFRNNTIIQERVNCKNCLRIMKIRANEEKTAK